MSPSEIVNRFFNEVWNDRRFDLLGEIIDPACLTHQVRSAPGGIAVARRGPSALREHIESWLTAFPEIQVTIDLRCVWGANVISWMTMRGIHRGPWQGVAATGREVTIRSVAQHRVEKDRIVEDWVIVETLGFFQQLGLVAPTPDLLADANQRTS